MNPVKTSEAKPVTSQKQPPRRPRRDNLNDPKLYINRELSLLEFQRRVLEEARDPRNPLLERVKFLAIVGSNLDEFFMVRVAGLKEQVAAGVVDPPPDGLTPAQQLKAIRLLAQELMSSCRECFTNEIQPALSKEGIHVVDYSVLGVGQRSQMKEYFDDVVFPVLTPLAFDPGRPFPHISNMSLNLAVVIRDEGGQEHFARIKVPSSLPRMIPIHGPAPGRRSGGHPHLYWTWIEQVIAANLDCLFPGKEIVESHPFRVTRNADMVIQELEAGDLLETIEEGVRQRQFGRVVRVTVDSAMPAHIRNILVKNLKLGREDMYAVEAVLGLSGIMGLASIKRRDLRFPHYSPVLPPALRDLEKPHDIFAAIRRQDILLNHPYDSFSPVVDFLREAARDPDVLAIKQTLYRVGKDSPVVKALLEARENGKQVAVLVELKARFDEESNIHWARELEKQGVHVVYGLLGLKTHSKIALVVRKEGEKIRRYVHLATGNYNAVTANLYTDMGQFTCDDEIGADATDLFNYLTGYSSKSDYRKLLVAPINLRSRMEQLIEREIDHQKSGERGHLIFTMNSLVDVPMIRALYRASQAGVQVDLVVRGICCLRPGVPGLSDNIRVISLVGRFLEHTRTYYFRNGGSDEVFLGSADLMPRNINSRVEVLFPIEDLRLVRHVRDQVLGIKIADCIRARELRADGHYERVRCGPKQKVIDCQQYQMSLRYPEGSGKSS